MPTINFETFHQTLATSVPLPPSSVSDLPPISFVLSDGRSVTYRIADNAITWAQGTPDESGTVLEIDETSFGTFALEYLTAPALQIQQRITFVRGDFGDLDRWEPLLRLLFAGRPMYQPDAVDRSQLTREFIWGEDSLEAVSEYFHTYGFAIVRRVFTPEEVTELDTELDRLAAAADPNDGDSWWVASDTSDNVCQLHFISLTSPLVDQLERDARIAQIVHALHPDYVAHPASGVGHFAVFKNPGITGGLSDLAWHVDCGLGGHPVTCPSLHIGVQVRAMTEESGPMKFLAGSHLTSSVRPSKAQEQTWPIVTVTAEPGDITLHSPDAVHAAPPPSGDGEGRRTIYLSFGRLELSELFGHKEGYDHIIFPKEGHVEFEADS